MIVNGLQCLALIDSAGYSRAEMPLDDSCSLVAPNNTGKTSLINALQYVLIADGTRMNFGEHARDASRRFYFPRNTSYVLAQIQQPDGQVIIGCVGKGHAHDYEYFAYKGALDLNDFRGIDGEVVSQAKLKAHMAELGKTVYTYSPGDFSDGLYGRNRKRSDTEPNFNLFRLEHSAYTGVFQTVLTRTLRLDRLTSADVKRFLLEIFKHELTDATIDFQAAWDRAFAQVNNDRMQYAAAVRLSDRINGFGQDLDELLSVRGKIIAHRPIIDDLLRSWATTYKAEHGSLEVKRNELRETLDNLGDQQEELGCLRERASNALKGIEEKIEREDALANTFALVSSRQQLVEKLDSTRVERDKLVTLINNASGRSLDALKRELRAAQDQRNLTAARLNSLEDNLYLHVVEAVGADQAQIIAQLTHPAALSLPPAEFQLDKGKFKRAVAGAAYDGRIRLSGLEIRTGTLPPAPALPNREDLELQLFEQDSLIERLQEQLATAESIETAKTARTQLEVKIKQEDQQLADFDEYQTLLSGSADRLSRRQQFLDDIVDLDGRLTRCKENGAKAREEEDSVSNQLRALESDNRNLERLRDNRRDIGPAFDNLPHMPHHEWIQPINIPVRDLPTALASFVEDCQRKGQLEMGLRNGLNEAHAGGLTKFLGASETGFEAEIKHMVNFVGALPQEAETLERSARQAVVDVSSSLVDLRRSLDEMAAKTRDFNKLISQRKLSDLAVFKLDLVQIDELVDAIDKLLSMAKSADSGQTFALFNKREVLGDEELDRAKQVLINEGQQNNGLKLENLFRLEFKVAKRGHEVDTFYDLEQSASLGTILMAKLVIGLAMLHLMRDKRSPSQAVCYLDEAATLDPANQRSLIETSREFGFSLIFASPLPLTTARYCVPIDTVGGKNFISRRRWQVIGSEAEQTT